MAQKVAEPEKFGKGDWVSRERVKAAGAGRLQDLHEAGCFGRTIRYGEKHPVTLINVVREFELPAR